MTSSDLLMLAPWVLFGAALATIAARLLLRRGGTGRRGAARRPGRRPGKRRED
jgi:hypothetical protein